MRIPLCLLCAVMTVSLLSGCTQNSIYVLPESTGSTESSVSSSTESTASANSDLLRPDPYDIGAFQLTTQEQRMLELVQERRAGSDLAPVEIDETLCALAYIRARETYALPDPASTRRTELFAQFGYTCQISAEAYVCTDSAMSMEQLFDIWFPKSSLSKTLTNPEFTRIGVGIYLKDGYTVVVCLLTN